ncbi:calcium/sodium antiporter [bacterium]|nr:calcium/sodium antiporter [bacterium]
MDIVTLILFLAGLVFLVAGAEMLVKGASRIAAALGISPLVIGLTVVAFGTSAPEMAVSVQSSLEGQADIAIGNVVGSNIFNVLFILGISAIITPLIVQQQLIRLDVPLMIAVSILTYGFAYDGQIQRWEGIVLFLGIVAYTVFLIRQSRKENKEIQAEYAKEFSEKPKPGAIGFQIVLVIAGLALLVVGSDWLVAGAVAIAKLFGVSELIIGLTIIAAGTSLPEVATSIIAAIRGERDIAVGNVVGSNIFNILAVLGLSATVAPQAIPVAPSAISFDIVVMIAVAVACLPIFFTGNIIARWEGFVFLAYYIAYTLFLILNTTGHDALPRFSIIMMEFVIPITALTLAILAVRSYRKNSKPAR